MPNPIQGTHFQKNPAGGVRLILQGRIKESTVKVDNDPTNRVLAEILYTPEQWAAIVAEMACPKTSPAEALKFHLG